MVEDLARRITSCEQDNARLRKQLKRQNRIWSAALLAAMIGTR